MDLKKAQGLVPGTQQVQIVPAVTMFMGIITWVVTDFLLPEGVAVPEEVWGSVTGLLIYGLQYWHGPREGL
jgi:hypothetical protein